MSEISAGVPTKAAIPPADIPSAALVRKLGGEPSAPLKIQKMGV